MRKPSRFLGIALVLATAITLLITINIGLITWRADIVPTAAVTPGCSPPAGGSPPGPL